MINYLQNAWYEITHVDRLTWRAWGLLVTFLVIGLVVFMTILKLAAYLRIGNGDYFA